MVRRRTRAVHFGDNPRARGGKERRMTNIKQPWERKYWNRTHKRKIYKVSSRVRPHYRKVRGRKTRIRVSGHIRKLR